MANDPKDWSVDTDMGMLKFESPEEAQKAAKVFGRMQADANRYRFLRDTPPWKSPVTVIMARDVGDDVLMLTHDGLDTVIDQAIASASLPQGGDAK